jgi:hypothetical protein
MKAVSLDPDGNILGSLTVNTPYGMNVDPDGSIWLTVATDQHKRNLARKFDSTFTELRRLYLKSGNTYGAISSLGDEIMLVANGTHGVKIYDEDGTLVDYYGCPINVVAYDGYDSIILGGDNAHFWKLNYGTYIPEWVVDHQAGYLSIGQDQQIEIGRTKNTDLTAGGSIYEYDEDGVSAGWVYNASTTLRGVAYAWDDVPHHIVNSILQRLKKADGTSDWSFNHGGDIYDIHGSSDIVFIGGVRSNSVG